MKTTSLSKSTNSLDQDQPSLVGDPATTAAILEIATPVITEIALGTIKNLFERIRAGSIANMPLKQALFIYHKGVVADYIAKRFSPERLTDVTFIGVVNSNLTFDLKEADGSKHTYSFIANDWVRIR